MSSANNPRLSRRHSVDVINAGTKVNAGTPITKQSVYTEFSDISSEKANSASNGGVENLLSRTSHGKRNFSRRASADVTTRQDVGSSPDRRFSLDLANLTIDEDSLYSNRGRDFGDGRQEVGSARRMSLPALYLSNNGQLLKGKGGSNFESRSSTPTGKPRKPPKRTPRSLAQLRSDPNHCDYLLRRNSEDDQNEGGEEDSAMVEFEEIKSCRYIRRPSQANEELTIAEIFS